MFSTLKVVLLLGVFALRDADGNLIGDVEPRFAREGDGQIVSIPDRTWDQMLPILDRRGRPRWRWNGDQVELVPTSDRRIPVEEYLIAWREWADARAAYLATQEYVDSRPALQALVRARIAELRAELDELTRPGRAEDEP